MYNCTDCLVSFSESAACQFFEKKIKFLKIILAEIPEKTLENTYVFTCSEIGTFRGCLHPRRSAKHLERKLSGG